MTGLLSVNWIRLFCKVDKGKKRSMIEGLNNLKTMGVNKKGYRKLQYKGKQVARKALPHRKGANFANFEDDDKAEHHSELPSNG